MKLAVRFSALAVALLFTAIVAAQARLPEGITRVKSGDQSFTFIVFDTSGYAAKN